MMTTSTVLALFQGREFIALSPAEEPPEGHWMQVSVVFQILENRAVSNRHNWLMH